MSSVTPTNTAGFFTLTILLACTKYEENKGTLSKSFEYQNRIRIGRTFEY